MFWGLIMEPQRRYTQKVKKAFHISMASLDISTSSEEPAQVMCGIDGRNYLLCTLRKPDVMQCPLDLNFNVGCDLSFAANGKCHVHLTGYLIEEFPELSEEEEVEEQSEEEVEKQPVKKKKRDNKITKNGPPSKKTKVSSDSDNDDDNSDSSDVNLEDLLHKSFDEDENDDTYVEEEDEENGSDEAEDGEEEEEEGEEENDDDDDDEEEEDESSQSDSGEEESNIPEKKKEGNLKMNGISSKSKKGKNITEKNTPVKEVKTPNKESKSNEKESKTPKKESKGSKTPPSPNKKLLQGGVLIEEIKEGQGPVAKAGKFITVYYEGRLKSNNKMFDSTTKGNGFSFRLGSGEVIKGWDVGVAGMKIGGKRRITCPAAMAYGAKGSPPAIPANSTLVFEVELKKVK